MQFGPGIKRRGVGIGTGKAVDLVAGRHVDLEDRQALDVWLANALRYSMEIVPAEGALRIRAKGVRRLRLRWVCFAEQGQRITERESVRVLVVRHVFRLIGGERRFLLHARTWDQRRPAPGVG